MSEARRIAQEYNGEASWVPVARVLPPESEEVEVLYADGVVVRGCKRAGYLWITPDGTYRYAEAIFWRTTT